MARIGFFTSHNLDQQGFGNLSEAAKARQAWPLRFTPAVCITVVAVGLALQSPVMVGAVALVGVTGVLFPNGMVVDLLYNAVVRHLVGAPRLPPTRAPGKPYTSLRSSALSTASCWKLLIKTCAAIFRSCASSAKRRCSAAITCVLPVPGGPMMIAKSGVLSAVSMARACFSVGLPPLKVSLA